MYQVQEEKRGEDRINQVQSTLVAKMMISAYNYYPWSMMNPQKQLLLGDMATTLLERRPLLQKGQQAAGGDEQRTKEANVGAYIIGWARPMTDYGRCGNLQNRCILWLLTTRYEEWKSRQPTNISPREFLITRNNYYDYTMTMMSQLLTKYSHSLWEKDMEDHQGVCLCQEKNEIWYNCKFKREHDCYKSSTTDMT